MCPKAASQLLVTYALTSEQPTNTIGCGACPCLAASSFIKTYWPPPPAAAAAVLPCRAQRRP